MKDEATKKKGQAPHNPKTSKGKSGKQELAKTARREKSDKMIAEYRSLTVVEKIRRLDERLGLGKGAVKQRARLAKEYESTVFKGA